MDINALLDKSFDELTAEEWAALKVSGNGAEDEESDRASELEARLAQSVSDWAKFNQVISDILNS